MDPNQPQGEVKKKKSFAAKFGGIVDAATAKTKEISKSATESMKNVTSKDKKHDSERNKREGEGSNSDSASAPPQAPVPMFPPVHPPTPSSTLLLIISLSSPFFFFS